jgi:alkylation response protein AidB-like acyl-CoA dehydrogenase
LPEAGFDDHLLVSTSKEIQNTAMSIGERTGSENASRIGLRVARHCVEAQRPIQRAALRWRGMVIGGGSPDIARHIIAKRLLGPPKD